LTRRYRTLLDYLSGVLSTREESNRLPMSSHSWLWEQNTRLFGISQCRFVLSISWLGTVTLIPSNKRSFFSSQKKPVFGVTWFETDANADHQTHKKNLEPTLTLNWINQHFGSIQLDLVQLGLLEKMPSPIFYVANKRPLNSYLYTPVTISYRNQI
jgi:hypothetical protein